MKTDGIKTNKIMPLMKILLKGLREGLGRLIAFFSWLFAPKQIKRTAQAQAEVNKECEILKLYQFYGCPFCIKVRRSLRRLNLPIEMRNAQSGKYRSELLAAGGQIKVPCLCIKQGDKLVWMYESNDINQYLNQRFG